MKLWHMNMNMANLVSYEYYICCMQAGLLKLIGIARETNVRANP